VQRKSQYLSTAVNIPGTSARFRIVSSSEITTTVPSSGSSRDGDGDDLSYEAQQDCDVPAAMEISGAEMKDPGSRPGPRLVPSFNLLLRADLLAHLRRTFR
jgi:hypothetical protein